MPAEWSDEDRELWVIAEEIKALWKNVNYAARPYLEAMGRVSKPSDYYGYDSAASLVRYFLSNATAWRGADARRIKAELRRMVG